MTNQSELQNYPKIYAGEFAEIYDLSSELPYTAFAFWKGFFQVSDEKFVKEMLETANLVKTAEIKVYISDHSYLKVVSGEVLNWLHANWYRNSSDNGLLLELAIDARNAFGKISLKKMLDATKIGNIKTMYINNLEEGKEAAKLFLKEEAFI